MAVRTSGEVVTKSTTQIDFEVFALGVHPGDASSPSEVAVGLSTKDVNGNWFPDTQKRLNLRDSPTSLSTIGKQGADVICKMVLAAKVPSTGAAATILSKLDLTAPVTVEQLFEAFINKREQIVQQETAAATPPPPTP
jgi:hypothetical protein